jgi:flagellin-like protein
MMQNNSKSFIRKLSPQKRNAVAEVISSLLLVAITVVGAVILTSFLDESFVSGNLAVSSSTDSTIKTIKLRAYDTRNGDVLMQITQLNNTHATAPQHLCRDSCVPNQSPADGGSDFLVIQIENRSVNPIFLKDVYLDSVGHSFDPSTVSQTLVVPGEMPDDGTFSILSSTTDEDGIPVDLVQKNNEITGGQVVNLLIKLDGQSPDIELSKTIRVQLNIGENSLSEFLIESGDAV